MTNTPLPPVSDPRQAWLKGHGYTGDEPIVVLRTGKVAKAHEVWKVLEGLRELRRVFPRLFLLTGIAAAGDRLPHDTADSLASLEFGELTIGHGTKREWAAGRLEIILALLDVNPDDLSVEFADVALAMNPDPI